MGCFSFGCSRAPQHQRGCSAARWIGIVSFLLSVGAAHGADSLSLTQTTPGNVFLTTETAAILATTTADTVSYTVTDFANVSVSGPSVKVDGSQRATLHPGSGAPGWFQLHVTALRAGVVVAQADTTFAVVRPVNVAAMSDSPFGVMTHFAQGWNTDLLPLISRAGLRHIRDEQYWANVETTRGQYTFDPGYTAYMAGAAQNGLDPLMELTFANALYDHDPAAPLTAWSPVTDDGRTGYANYAGAILTRYGAQIDTCEVWNEYNGSFCTGPATTNRAVDYTKMLQVAYQKIKAQRPDVRVLGGATALAPQPWFEDLFAQGALASMDAIAIHPYVSVPEDVERPIHDLQATMARYLPPAAAKPIWATETAVPDPTHPGRQDMARALVRLLTLLRANGVERVYWYLARDYGPFVTGLLGSDQSALGRYAPSAAYPAYANLVQQLYHAQFVRREPTDPRTRLYLFSRTNGPLRVLWSTSPPSKLLLRASQPVTLVDIMGNATTIRPQGGVIPLTVDGTPVFLAGNIDTIQEVGRDLLLADSVGGFGSTQGTAPGSWSYGYWRAGTSPYQPGSLQPMTWTRGDWDYRWQCPYAFAEVDDTNQHPGADGTTPVWTVRRWQSGTAGTARITGQATRLSTAGDGTGIKIVVDGTERFSALAGTTAETATVTFDLSVPLKAGSTVDFVTTPGPGADINSDAVDYRALITMAAPAVPTTFTQWQQQNFPPDQQSDPALAGDTAAPLGDGVPNLLKYALGFDADIHLPRDLEPYVETLPVDGQAYLALSFRRLFLSSDLAYTVEVTGGLGGNGWKAGGVQVGTPIDDGDGTELVTFRDDVPLNASPRRFMRLRVTHLSH